MIKRSTLLFYATLLFGTGEAGAVDGWVWYIHRAEVDSLTLQHLDVVVGIRAESEDPDGRLGNFSLRGRFSPDLSDFNAPNPPELDSVFVGSFEMTLTDAPQAHDWQLNGAYTGIECEGSAVDSVGIPVASLRFSIGNADGSSGFTIDSLRQTYRADNTTRVDVKPDTIGGNVPLIHIPAGIDDIRVPDRFILHPNFPNPFNGETRIEYELPENEFVQMMVYSLTGRAVRTLMQAERMTGRHHAVWDGTDDQEAPVPSGMYILRMEAGPIRKVRKMILVR